MIVGNLQGTLRSLQKQKIPLQKTDNIIIYAYSKTEHKAEPCIPWWTLHIVHFKQNLYS